MQSAGGFGPLLLLGVSTMKKSSSCSAKPGMPKPGMSKPKGKGGKKKGMK